jgi:long-chain fatty acid transport protein
MRDFRIHRRLTAVAVVALAVSPTLGSGFSIYEQDAKASAMAGAFHARADNAAANWYNPAAMVRQQDSFSVGINAITIGHDSTFTSRDPALQAGFGVQPGTEFDADSNVATPPHLYYVQRAGERVAWGFGITTPFGLITEWSSPISFAAKKSELHTFVFNPNVALALDDHWSVAFGLDYIYADLKAFSRQLTPAAELDLTGDGSDWGFNFALHYDSADYKAGLSFRGNFTPEIDGQLSQTGSPDVPGKADLRLPEQLAVGFAYTGAEKWELELDVSWARWSRFSELDIQLQGGGSIFILENWDDTYAIRLGGSYDLGQRHQLRYGILRDTNPIPDATLRPSIPDGDRWSGTLGYGYSGPKIDVDFYYMALFFDDRTVAPALSDLAAGGSVIAGDYENFSHLLGVTFGWRFGGGS